MHKYAKMCTNMQHQICILCINMHFICKYMPLHGWAQNGISRFGPTTQTLDCCYNIIAATIQHYRTKLYQGTFLNKIGNDFFKLTLRPKLGARNGWSAWGTQADGLLLLCSPEIYESILELGTERLKLSS